MEQYYKVTIKIAYEDKKGNMKYRNEPYIVLAISPSDIDAKIAKKLGTGDYEIIGINLTKIVAIIE